MDILKISEWYENNPIARIIVNAIPSIGGSLDVALSAKWNLIQKNRVEDLLQKLSDELADLKEQVLDKNVLESEEFFDLIYGIARIAVSNRSPEIRTASARILKASFIEGEKIVNLEDLVRQLSDFREKDIVFLRAVKRLFDGNQRVTGSVLSTEVKEYTASPIESELQLYRFEAMGLLDHPRNSLIGRGLMAFEKLPLFDKMVSYLGL